MTVKSLQSSLTKKKPIDIVLNTGILWQEAGLFA